MKFNLAITVTSAVILMIFDSTVTAQQQTLTVQQPVVSQFNVRNSVSVPDGGSIGLGGISRSSTGVLSRGDRGSLVPSATAASAGRPPGATPRSASGCFPTKKLTKPFYPARPQPKNQPFRITNKLGPTNKNPPHAQAYNNRSRPPPLARSKNPQASS